MKINFIQSEEEYKKAEARLEIIAGAIPGTVEAQELKGLTQAVVSYLKQQSQPQQIKEDLPPDNGPKKLF